MDKLLTESGLKAILSKNKIKDNGLQKALAAYEKLDDDAHDECLDQLAQIGKLATTLKKVKEVAGNKAVADYLDDMLDAKDDEEQDVTKDKEKAEKNETAAQKKAEKEKNDKDKDKDDEDEDEEDEQEQGEYGDRLFTAFKKCRTLNGDPMDFIICEARPFPAIMLAKRITSKHRKELTEMADGSKKFHRGTCHFENGKYVITTDQALPGLVRRVQLSVKNYTGKKFKFMLGDETAGDEEDETPEAQTEEEPTSRGGGSPQGDAGTQDDDSQQGDASPQASTGAGASPQASTGSRGGASPQASAGAQAGAGGQSSASSQASAGAQAGQAAGGAGGAGAAEGAGAAGAAGAAAGQAAKGPFSISGTVGRGGKNTKEDVEAVQTALNRVAHAGLKVDGGCGPKTIAAIMAFQKTMGQGNPDGVVAPGRGTARGLEGSVKPGPPAAPPAPVAPPTLPKAELSKAPEIWNKTRDILKTNIGELKKAVQGHYAAEHPDLVKQIDRGLGKLDGILETLDTKLSDSLGKAAGAAGDAARKAELQNSKRILTTYINYVKGEPLIAHIDKNPFGVNTNIKRVLTDGLTHMAQAMAQGTAA